MDERIKRIEEMENALNRALAAVDGLERALEDYSAAKDDISLLADYLNSDERRRDILADEAGILPDDLNRGVLSEDAVWDLLECNDSLIEEMRSTVLSDG